MLNHCMIALLIAFPFVLAAETPVLFPQPKQARFGQDKLSLKNVSIGFTSATDDVENGLVQREIFGVFRDKGIAAAKSEGRGLITLERTGRNSSWQWDDAAGPESSEWYSIRVERTGVTLQSRTARGLFYAAQTLRQLIQGHGADAWVPECNITDWPSLRLRGFMLDLSHGPFPKFDELKRHIDLLALWKANQFYLYSETNIELDGFPLLSQKARLSKAQVRELVRYARERFVDVVPCVELYGHLHDLVRVERHSTLGETPHGGEIDPRNPQALALIRNWVDQFVELFPSPFFHIGLDETYEIGKMPGRELTTKAAGELYLEFFEKVSRIVSEKKKRVMVWADIFLDHPEVIPRISPGTIAVPWHYQDEPDYDRWVAPLGTAKVTSMVAPGVWNYNEPAPDFDHTIRNVNGLLKSAAKFKSIGLLHTEWTDNGQVFFNMADPGVAVGLIGAWTGGPIAREEFYDKYARIRHPDTHSQVSQMLKAVSEAQAALESALGRRGMFTLWMDPFERPILDLARKNVEQLRLGRKRAEDAQELLLSLGREDQPIFRSLLYGARLMDYLAQRYLYALEIEDLHHALSAKPTRASYRLFTSIQMSDYTHSRLLDLMDTSGELREEMREIWLSQYEPFRLQTALGRWNAEFEQWRAIQQKLMDGHRNFQDGEAVPSLRVFLGLH